MAGFPEAVIVNIVSLAQTALLRKELA